jgi:hypothetical protein
LYDEKKIKLVRYLVIEAMRNYNKHFSHPDDSPILRSISETTNLAAAIEILQGSMKESIEYRIKEIQKEGEKKEMEGRIKLDE